ncbi:MAG: PAS domain-containing protein [Chloroflexi bacterium]|nr:MAG: PAS domain-containing protein [Chloroflexota bacterium]
MAGTPGSHSASFWAIIKITFPSSADSFSPGRPAVDEILQLFTHTGDGVWAVDADHRIVLWSPVAEEILGYAGEEALGQLCYELLAGHDLEGRPFCHARCSVMEHARRGEPVRSFDLLAHGRDGSVHHVNVSILAVPQESAPEKPIALVHLFRRVGSSSPGPPPLRIYLLGDTMVQRASGSIVGGPLWRRAKVRALLAYLSLQRGQAVHRNALIDALWPDLEYPAALHNLNTTVYNLRRSLEPTLKRGADSSYIHYEGDCYSLNSGPVHWLDAVVFETDIMLARREADPVRAAALYREALALYRGDFMSDLLGHDIRWCWMERERLRELYLAALEELGELLEQQGQEEEASRLYLKALAVDACRETACRRLMRLAMRRGDRAAAVAHYRRLSEALRRELEVVPSQETRLLYEVAMRGG